MSDLRTDVSMPILRFAALTWQQVVLAGQVPVSLGNRDTACVRLSSSVTLNIRRSGTWTTRKVVDRAWIDAGIDYSESSFAAARTAARTASKSAWLDNNDFPGSTPIDSFTEAACTLRTTPCHWQCSGHFQRACVSVRHVRALCSNGWTDRVATLCGVWCRPVTRNTQWVISVFELVFR